MPSPEPLLKLIAVSKLYGSPDGASSITVLDGVSLEVQRGESLSIMGPSGSGKSTLLQIIGTLDHATSGQVLLEGHDLSALNEAEVAQVRNQKLGLVFQSHFLLPQCTVLENVLVPTLAGTVRQSANQNAPSAPGSQESSQGRAIRLLGRVGLEERLSHRPGELSGGERQRVSVVRALINQPQLLLADEPTGALDRASAQQLGELFVQLNREEGVTLIVVTHAMELARRMGRVLQLKDGCLVQEENGTPF